MESDLEGSDSSNAELEDHVSISLLPEQKLNRKRKFRGASFTFKLWKMFGGKAAIYGIVTALLLLSVLLLAVFARPSSSHETVNRNDKKNSRHDVELARDAPVFDQGQKKKESSSLRLPRHLSPIEYLVYLHPNLTTFKFSGKVDALLYCNEAANNIILHAGKKIHVTSVKVAHIPDLSDKSNIIELNIKSISHLPGEMMSISLDENSQLQSGEYYFVLIVFKSELSRGLSGFYLSKYYSPSGELRYLATTHFEPTDARNAFPCFDEPDLKARFTIVIVRERRHVALANMPVHRTEGCGDADELCTDHFEQSVKMSTYLVAFVVCDFKSLSNQTLNGIKVRVWAPPEQIHQAKFALDVAVIILQYYEKIFQVDYPLPKQDLIAIPDFSAGAMENWGLITYRLTSLLYDEHKSSDSNKQWVAVVVAHELAHQWFGNLVTMKWWNDLWLNEGFASFMENVGVNHVAPEWKMMDQFLLDKYQVSMSLDQLSNSHPIMAEVKDPAEINSLFDSISYDKGASIIRMLEDVLGRGVFFKGLQHYLKKYSFSNAETIDLWQCLTQANENQKGVGKGINVAKMMKTWTSQMGFPVITVKRDKQNPHVLQAKQQRFYIHPGSKPSSDAEWHEVQPQADHPLFESRFFWVVPLTIMTQDSDDRNLEMMEEETIQVTLPVQTSAKSWIKLNAGQSGFYRVNYDNENWRKFVVQLNTYHEALPAGDRAGLLDDALNLARSDMLQYSLALDLTTYLKKEKEYVPWMSALNNLAYFATQFSAFDAANNETDYYTTYKRYIFYLIKDITQELGWEENSQDTHLKRYLRATMLHLASEYEDAVPKSDHGFTSHASELFDKWLNHNQSITPNLRNIVYSIGMKGANNSTWMEVFSRYQKESVPSEKRKLMYALTNSRDQDILNRFLELSLQEDKIRSQDSVAVINSIASNPEGRLIAWEFFKKHYPELFRRYGEGSFDFSRLIKANTAHFNTPKMLKEVKYFFAGKDQGSGKLAVKQSLESIDANIKWIDKHGLDVNGWLERFPSDKSRNAPVKQRTFYSYDEMMMMEKYGRP